MKKGLLGIVLCSLMLFTLSGCGSKLDKTLLSEDGGEWKVSVGNTKYEAQFDSDGEGEWDDIACEYTILDNDNNYTLKIKSDDFDHTLKIKVNKNDISKNSFTGLEDSGEYTDVYHFEKAK